MKSKVSRILGQKHLENVKRDKIDIDYCIRNVSVQTGEEFSPQFLQNLTLRRKVYAGGESCQEYKQDHVTSGRTVQKGKDFHTKILETVKECISTRIPTEIGVDRCQQKRVEFKCNQNEKLVYEYRTDSIISKKDPVNVNELSDFQGGKGLQKEAEQTVYPDATNKYNYKDYTIRGYHQNPQPSSTYTNEVYNVQTGLQAYKPCSHVPGLPEDSISAKMKFLCSFGGKILTRPSDGKFRYVGGETRIISIKKNLNYIELKMRTYAICNQPHIIKYQLPGEDLDALVSVCSDEDFHHMIDEYEELEKGCQRLRIFLESINERESPGSSRTSSIEHTDNTFKYVVAVNGIPEPSLQSSSSRVSPSNFTKKLPTPTQFIQPSTNMSASCMQSPLVHVPVQYGEAIQTQLRVSRDHADQPAYECIYRLDELHLYSQRNDDVKKPVLNASAIKTEKFVPSQKQSIDMNNPLRQNMVPSAIVSQPQEPSLYLQQRDMVKEKTETSKCENLPVIWNLDISKHYIDKDQNLIKWVDKNHINTLYDLDTEECQNDVSLVTPLEMQLSIATTVSTDTGSCLSSGLQHNTSLETSKLDIKAENPRLLTTDINENNHLDHDSLFPCKAIVAPISSQPSLAEKYIDNLGDMSLSQTPDEKNKDYKQKFLPPNIDLSATDYFCIQGETIDRVATPNVSENESVGQYDSKDIKDEKKTWNGGPITDATIAEIQAGIHGLQTIRNADLEELSELGCGTFGTVYHGKWRGTDVAIKRIKESSFAGKPTEDDRLIKDFWREAQILSQLHHPNVVALYGVVRDGPKGSLSTITEYMANGSLRHVLSKKKRALDQRKKIMIAQDAARGMEYLHMKNIVHFDLKCDNLLVNLGDPERPVCKVGDFGLSRIKRHTLVSGGVRGTLPWIAPELLDGSSNRVSEKVDVFSFGVVMWEILTGEEPYADMHCGAIIGGIVTNTLRPPIPTRCDHHWRALMEECWSNDPSDRPSFTEVANKLQAMLVALQSKKQKRLVKDGHNHNHMYNNPALA